MANRRNDYTLGKCQPGKATVAIVALNRVDLETNSLLEIESIHNDKVFISFKALTILN